VHVIGDAMIYQDRVDSILQPRGRRRRPCEQGGGSKAEEYDCKIEVDDMYIK
jgi:hypothetical protein